MVRKQRRTHVPRARRTKMLHRDRIALRRSMVTNYIRLKSFYKVGKMLHTHPYKVSYWNRKFSDPTYHSGRHGGPRSVEKFPKDQNEQLLKIVVSILSKRENRSLNLRQLRLQLIPLLGYSFSANCLSCFLKRNRWSWKVLIVRLRLGTTASCLAQV